jgi:N-acetylneuraminic acid mutarotase
VVALRTIVAFTPGSGARVAAMLPLPLRYAAVAAVGGHVLIAGGTSGETAQRSILSFDPATGAVRQIGTLPQPLTHAAAASLDGRLLVFGGRGGERTSQRAAILSIDPATGATSNAGRLPQPLSDVGAASLGAEVLLVGGRDRSGRVHDQALTYRPAR